jgi:hypothetical protein
MKTYRITYSLSLPPQCFSEGRNDLGRIIRFGCEPRHVAAKVTALSVFSLEEENVVIFPPIFSATSRLTDTGWYGNIDGWTYVWLLI